MKKTFIHIGCSVSPTTAKAVANAILGKTELTGKLKYKSIKI